MFGIGSCPALHHINDINIHQSPICGHLIVRRLKWTLRSSYLTRISRWVVHFASQPCTCIKMDEQYNIMVYIEEAQQTKHIRHHFHTVFQ